MRQRRQEPRVQGEQKDGALGGGGGERHLALVQPAGARARGQEQRFEDLLTLPACARALGMAAHGGHAVLYQGARRGRLRTIRPGGPSLTTRAWALDYLRADTDYEDWLQRARLWPGEHGDDDGDDDDDDPGSGL